MINSIRINAKEWFDKINGNSYFCGVITVNNERNYLIPFQYGYGSQYEHEAKCILTEFNQVSTEYNKSLSKYCKENNIQFQSNIIRNCLKRELKAIETNYNNNQNHKSFN